MADLSGIDLSIDHDAPLSTRTEYGGVLMRSKLETMWAQFFDDQGVEWVYEPQKYRLRRGYYIPDFSLSIGTPRADRTRVFVEVKPDGVWSHKAACFADEKWTIVILGQGEPQEDKRYEVFDPLNLFDGAASFRGGMLVGWIG
jgi:hypothetical protein